jgi:hypothetical protein
LNPGGGEVDEGFMEGFVEGFPEGFREGMQEEAEGEGEETTDEGDGGEGTTVEDITVEELEEID